jgi:hypothetical protein
MNERCRHGAADASLAWACPIHSAQSCSAEILQHLHFSSSFRPPYSKRIFNFASLQEALVDNARHALRTGLLVLFFQGWTWKSYPTAANLTRLDG